MNRNVIAAIFRRNFVSYFANPTGYVFICVFVLFGSFAAFWPDEFFNANLANLDQLNKSFPFIMLVFIPAITMSIWADERRQGTDELAADDSGGRHRRGAGQIFRRRGHLHRRRCCFRWSAICWCSTRSACPILACSWALTSAIGWSGLAMLAIGMVGSFLTGNFTVAFILGVAFNAPLVFLNVIDTIVRGSSWTATAKGWSIGEADERFRPRRNQPGVDRLTFLMIAVVMLYLCMVLIGRRHWLGGRGGKSTGSALCDSITCAWSRWPLASVCWCRT